MVSKNAAHHSLIASWQRSARLHRLQPDQNANTGRLSANEFNHSREKLGPLIHTAQNYLDRLYQAVGGDGCCILLADKDGIPVTRRGTEGDDIAFRERGLWTGTRWSENTEGTNGIGTCIVEERALTIHQGQHFHSKNVSFSCTASPIFDHQGKLVAALDVSTCRKDLTPGFSRLISMSVVDIARQIEMAYFEYHFANARVLLASPPEEYKKANSCTLGASLVAVDGDDLVIGATRAARRLFDLSDDDLKNPLPLNTLYGQEINDAKNYAQAGRRTISQALARNNGNVSATAQALGVSRATLHRKIKQLRLKTR